MEKKLHIINCPYCNKKMEEGFISSPYVILWMHKEAKFELFKEPPLHKKSIQLGKHSLMSGCKVIAYCCHECNKVVIDYNSEK